jgi:hypothetical protein
MKNYSHRQCKELGKLFGIKICLIKNLIIIFFLLPKQSLDIEIFEKKPVGQVQFGSVRE